MNKEFENNRLETKISLPRIERKRNGKEIKISKIDRTKFKK